MLSIPHMIVVFVVVLVVFGPQKLPELARSFGKLMAEFRKASNDFKSAFEEEMRDLERQARIAELKKQVAEATAAANAAIKNSAPVTNAAPSQSVGGDAGTGYGVTQGTAPESPEVAAGSPTAEAPVISPVPESVPRLDANPGKGAAEPSEATHGEAAGPVNGTGEASQHDAAAEPYKENVDHATESSSSHGQRQPA